MSFIEEPDPAIKAKWGPLAHVNEAERSRILSLPYGGFGHAVAALEKRIAEYRKSEKRKAKESEFKRMHRHISTEKSHVD